MFPIVLTTAHYKRTRKSGENEEFAPIRSDRLQTTLPEERWTETRLAQLLGAALLATGHGKGAGSGKSGLTSLLQSGRRRHPFRCRKGRRIARDTVTLDELRKYMHDLALPEVRLAHNGSETHKTYSEDLSGRAINAVVSTACQRARLYRSTSLQVAMRTVW